MCTLIYETSMPNGVNKYFVKLYYPPPPKLKIYRQILESGQGSQMAECEKNYKRKKRYEE